MVAAARNAVLPLNKILVRKIRSRSFKAARREYDSATHVVRVSVNGVGTSIDTDLFRAANGYSDNSGYGGGCRDHEWYVDSLETAEATRVNIDTVMKSLETLNKCKISYSVEVLTRG